MRKPQSPDSTLASLASRQAGAFNRKQALDVGLSRRQIDRRLSSGAWFGLFTGAYVFAGAPVTWTTWAWAGVLSGGVGSTVIGGSAAAVRSLLPQTWPITIAVPPQSRRTWPRSRLKPFNLHIPRADVVPLGGLAVTSRLRTAVDCAHLLGAETAQQLIDRMLVLELIDLPSLVAAVSESSRNGSKQARRLVRQASDRAASEAERLCHRILRAAGLDWFVANYAVEAGGRTYKVDLAFVTERVAIEIQGWAFHQLPEQRRADDAKATELQLAGWLVIRLTWQDLVGRPDWVVAQVRAALTRP